MARQAPMENMMGCDIHCYIEFKTENFNGWQSFGGRINPGRDYTFFGLLAGQRGPGPSMIPLRGMPSDAAYESSDDNSLFISNVVDEERCCTAEEAEGWVKRGQSTYLPNATHPLSVTNPDWHSHSWVTPDEWEQVLKAADEDTYDMIKYYTILATLRGLEKQAAQARVVFWFDN